jgi:hypothetical protein
MNTQGRGHKGWFTYKAKKMNIDVDALLVRNDQGCLI